MVPSRRVHLAERDDDEEEDKTMKACSPPCLCYYWVSGTGSSPEKQSPTRIRHGIIRVLHCKRKSVTDSFGGRWCGCFLFRDWRGSFLCQSWNRTRRRRLWNNRWARRGSNASDRLRGRLEVSLNDIRQNSLHALVARFQFLNGFFNGRNEILFTIPCHFCMHSIAFSTKRLQLFVCQLALGTTFIMVQTTLPVDVRSTSANPSRFSIDNNLERLRRSSFTRSFREEPLSLSSNKLENVLAFDLGRLLDKSLNGRIAFSRRKANQD
mmetsp:Transcript_25258/g.44302  ORF Transcript_25258/g.44302 Transcript_25258/m.44302 type:complete len:266 (-) Transcript_25258:406-1203(-)